MTRDLASEREPEVRVLYRISWSDAHDPFKAQKYCIEYFFLCHGFFRSLDMSYAPGLSLNRIFSHFQGLPRKRRSFRSAPGYFKSLGGWVEKNMSP